MVPRRFLWTCPPPAPAGHLPSAGAEPGSQPQGPRPAVKRAGSGVETRLETCEFHSPKFHGVYTWSGSGRRLEGGTDLHVTQQAGCQLLPRSPAAFAGQVASLAPVVGSRQCSRGGTSSGRGVWAGGQQRVCAARACYAARLTILRKDPGSLSLTLVLSFRPQSLAREPGKD